MSRSVLVIGAGISGLISAIRARKLGNDVTVAFSGKGATSLSLGVVDVLGYVDRRAVRDPLKGIEELIKKKPRHVYSLVGVDNIKKSINFFKELTKEVELEYVGDLRKNIYIATQFGTIKPTCLALKEVYDARVDTWDGKKVSISGSIVRDYHPKFISDSLSFFLPKFGIDVRFVDENYADIVLRPLSQKKEESCVIPLLGDGEILRKKLFKYAQKIGVEFIKDTIKKGKIKGNEVKEVYGRKSYEADVYILASGDWIGGGLNAFKEPIFNLDMIKSNGKLVRKIPFPESGHKYSKIGVKVNESLNPFINGNEIVNLKVAGSIIGNYDYCTEKSGFGVCISTAYLAASL